MAARSVVGTAALAFLLAFASVSAEKTKANVNPIRKITGLMENMQKEIEAEGAKEQVLYDKFMCFCDNGAADLLKAANEATAQNKAASSKLESDTAEKSQLESDLKQHETDLAAATKDLDEATNIRANAKAEYDETVATKSASDSALGKAIPAIEKGMGGAALLQFTGSPSIKQLKRAIRASQQLTDGNRQEVLAFLQGETPGSGEILGMLKSMKDELTRDLDGLEKTEKAAVAGFADMKASKEKEVEFAKESIESKKERVGTLAVEIVQGKDLVEDSAAEAEKAEKFAATLDTQCAAKKKEWAERSKMRADEVAAIGEAIGILTDDDALDVFKKAVPASAAMLQEPAHHVNRFTGEMNFLQARRAPAARLQKAQALIASTVAADKSQPMGLLFFSLRSKMRVAEKGAVDFTEINKMIDEMITILEKDNKDDATQRDFCVGELDKTEREKAATNDKLGSLESQIAELEGSIEETSTNIADLTAGVAALDKDVAEATEQRKEEHADFLRDCAAQ
jgi:septal ring factor EnvC (AmiA/AmiB activator)